MAAPTDLTTSELRRLYRAAGLAKGEDLATDLDEDLADIAALYAIENALSRRLFLLCVKQDFFDLILGPMWREFQTKYGDEQEHRDQMFTHLQALRSACEGDIETLREQIAAGSMGGGYASGDMVHQTPLYDHRRPGCFPNPNDRGYAGDPIRRVVFDPGDASQPSGVIDGFY